MICVPFIERLEMQNAMVDVKINFIPKKQKNALAEKPSPSETEVDFKESRTEPLVHRKTQKSEHQN